MAEFLGIVATAPSGSTATMELVSGREAAAKRIEELVESGHHVRLFKCTEVEYEVATSVTVYFK